MKQYPESEAVWGAWSAGGTVKGALVYANYGTEVINTISLKCLHIYM